MYFDNGVVIVIMMESLSSVEHRNGPYGSNRRSRIATHVAELL